MQIILSDFRGTTMTNEDRAYDYIKSQITSGIYQPGHILSENQMRIKLGMSRTPIREAFKKLENDGLIERNGQVTSVTKISFNELKENYDLRSMMESYALKKNFASLDHSLLSKFETNLQTTLKQEDWTKYLELDEQFHSYLTNTHNDSTLQKELDLLKSQTNRMRYTIQDNQRCMKSSVKEIMAIITAIKENDLPLAIEKLETHIKSVYDWESSYLSSKGDNND